MISKEDFITALGEKAEGLAPDDMEKMRIVMDTMADILFDMWNTDIVKIADHEAN